MNIKRFVYSTVEILVEKAALNSRELSQKVDDEDWQSEIYFCNQLIIEHLALPETRLGLHATLG